jgi:tetratricopeptide (TPR) repeat protein
MNKPTIMLGLTLSFLLPALTMAAEAKDYKDGGMALFRAGQYEKALDYFKNAVQADPNDWEAYQDLGDTYAKLNDSADARDAYQKSLQINPNNSTVQVSLDNLGGASPSVPPSQPAPATSRIDGDQPIQNPQLNPVRQRLVRRPAPVDGLAPMDHAKTWFKLEGAYNYSTHQDLFTSADSLNKFITANGATGSAMADHGGGLTGLELGFLLNPNNGLAIGIRALRTNDYLNNENLQNGPATIGGTVYNSDFENETISPYVYPLTLDYYLFLPDSGGRFFLSAGVGYYFGLVHVEDD